ncbi:MAG: glutamate-5-semialdehyde dehydrogenase [Epsilonproteobacteria bacterium]|nr:glutamate-5-semialdehyde dehydrogenase [Campylobacterota bacterium]
MESFLQKAKEASEILSTLPPTKKSEILIAMADALEKERNEILNANAQDMTVSRKDDLSQALLDRLFLDENRIYAMSKGIKEIASLKEPVGRVLEGWVNKDNLRIEKVSVPIGVIGIIYESRPNVTSDTAALCFKSGNVCILKGGKEAKNSNIAIASVLRKVLESFNLPKEAITLLPDYSREGVSKLIKMDKYVDLIIPRGGENLIRYISQNSTVPVIKHDKGLCHTYIDKDADIKKAVDIAVNAKVQRPGVCNAMETLLVDEKIYKDILPILKKVFDENKTLLKGCEKCREVIDVQKADEEDFHTEYLANILSIKVVKDLDEAVSHIQTYGSGHSEAIVSENYTTAEEFLNRVDASCVYVNASTRFTDGGEFGFGAEVGISTSKLHSRGPMGINDLTTYKYKIYGNGQIRK